MDKMITDQEIKDELFRLWAIHFTNRLMAYTECLGMLKSNYNFKTIHEIKALMQKDGIELSEINKIIGV